MQDPCETGETLDNLGMVSVLYTKLEMSDINKGN